MFLLILSVIFYQIFIVLFNLYLCVKLLKIRGFMKNIILGLIILLSLLVAATGAVLVSPYYFYNQIIKDKHHSKWYSVPNFQKEFLSPWATIKGDSSELGNADLWKKFHFMDVILPLPVKNPFLFVSPILKYSKDSKKSEFGLKLFGANDREISKFYFLPNKFFPNELNAQKLFVLPLVKKHLKSISMEKIWKDLFSLKIDKWNIPFAQMVYNLYILHLRSKILPDKYVQYALVDGTNTAIIELNSKNKDYITELILTNNRGVIYSFVLLTEKNNNESKLVRYKLLNEVQFQGGSPRLSDIIYREFKGLEYKEQVDHQGMLYLLSAWTHDKGRSEYIKEMINSLEKGTRNQRQLEALYSFAMSKYGTTYTEKDISELNLDDNVLLQRNLELENQAEIEALAKKEEIIEKPILSKEEKLRLMLDEVKRDRKENEKRMIID